MKVLLFSFAILLSTSTSLTAQDVEIEKFLDKAYRATVHYRETFKNLIAEELRTYDYFGRNGSLEDSRKIKSIFVVYESQRDKAVLEYRNVIEFNGKDVSRKDKDVVKLFEKLAKADSRSEEYERLRKEANRFDGKSHAYGLTLGQGIVLQPFYREFFEFQIVGKEKIEGRETIVIEYKQSRPTLRIKANTTDEENKKEPSGISFDAFLPDNFRPTNPRLQGKLWLDAETAQIWRDDFFVTIQPAFLSKPVISANFLYEYQPSEFNVLLPKKLEIVGFRFTGKGDKDLTKTKAATKTFEYSKFSKPMSEVKGTKTK